MQSGSDQTTVGQQVIEQLRMIAPVDREMRMRICMGSGMARKVLGGRRHARGIHAVDESVGKLCHDLGFGMNRPVADDLRKPEIQIDDRGKAQIDADGQKLGRHQPAEVDGGAAFRAARGSRS